MVICPDCGKEVPDAKFCKNCGAPLPKDEEVIPVEEVEPTVAEEVSPIEEEDDVSDEVSSILDGAFSVGSDEASPAVKKVEPIVNEEVEPVVEEAEPESNDSDDNLVTCPDCGKEVPSAKFCKNCGATLPVEEEASPVEEEVIPSEDEPDASLDSDVDMVVCPDCGMEVPSAKFCKNCGATLPVEEEASPVVTDEVSSVEDEPAAGEDENDDKVKFCHACGFEIEGDIRYCPNCGADLHNSGIPTQTITEPRDKNIIVAIVLSVIFPGLGQFYLGLNHKGLMFLIGYIISAVLILLLVGFILCFVIWIWALVDAIQSTNALNRGENVEDRLLA